MYDGGRVDLNWDTKWVSEVTFDKDRWMCEISIPLKSIRYKEGVNEWGINFGRLDLKEWSSDFNHINIKGVSNCRNETDSKNSESCIIRRQRMACLGGVRE